VSSATPDLTAPANEAEPPLGPDALLSSPEARARLGRLSLIARRLSESRRRGKRQTRRIGAGVDLVDTRPYVPGDDPRRIAWAAYARLEKLLIRLVADEAPLRLALVVDTSGSMAFGRPTKLRQATRVAAGVAAIAIKSEDRAAVASATTRAPGVVRASGGSAGATRMHAFLDALRPGGETDLAAAVNAVTSAVGGRALCVIVSDLLDPLGALNGARAARARGHEVALVEVLDPIEIDPPDLADVDLEDEETGARVTLPPGGVRAAYRAAFARHRREIDDGAAEIGAPVLHVTTEQAFDDVVADGLRAGLLRGGLPE
jgi:uncharacterized protein (DUF58 family)